MKQKQIEAIHESLVNGQRKQMVEQIDEYGVYDFWYDYRNYLCMLCETLGLVFDYFTDAAISYHRIKTDPR